MRVRLGVAAAIAAVLVAGALLLGCGGGGGHAAAGTQAATAPAASQAGAESSWMPSRSAGRSVVWAVGDAADGSPASHAVASMVTSRRLDRLLYLGDVYDAGTALEFDRNYVPLYGGLGDITAPTIGNHEWPNIATGYVPYWTSVRGTPPPLYYAFNVSGWQLISLNSNTPESGQQLVWLQHLIQTTPQYGDCRIAFDHHPFFSTGPHGGLDALQGIFGALRGHARIVLSGHDHDMQRFRPIGGIVQLVDGAGGAELYPFVSTDERRVFGNDTDHGALRLVLGSGRADLTFVAQDGTRLDRSTVSCTP
jgi:calcineurin-like phosphoesterase family protein